MSRDEYNRLSINDYLKISDINLPRRTTPYICFTKLNRLLVQNDIRRYSGEDLVKLSDLDIALSSKWNDLPDKGKLDY